MEVVSMEDDQNRLTQQRFDAAVKVIKSLPPDGSFQPSNDMMLKFYSFYKQATLGPCNIPRPGFWDAVGKAKWDAWNSLGEMPKEEAMAAYVDEMKLILEGMPITEEVEALLRILGPFYELVDEKKKITQISDLSAGIGTTMSGMASKSMAKSIIRTMEMNGTLDTIQRPSTLQPLMDGSDKEEDELGEEEEEEEEEEEDDEDDDEEDEEEEVVIKEVKKEKKPSASLPKKKGSARRSKTPLSNGQPAGHMTNGTTTHSKAALNSEESREDTTSSSTEPQLNGHHIDSNGDASGPQHLTSDSDSEVYCDSVDQFGQEESSENHQSIDDLEEEENHVTEEPHAPHRVPEEEEDPSSPSPLEGIQCGGEDGGEDGGVISQRQSAADSSLVRRGRGSRSSGLGSGAPVGAHVQGSGDGDGEHCGGAGGGGAPGGGSLNQQIVVALARLQEDMQSVLERLHTLEALTATQARSMALSPTYSPRPVNKSSKKPRWWPFDVSPSTVAFAVVWPFVVQWLLRLILQRRKRRIN